MFLCKRVRSEVGVDSVGVGGGELGQGLLPVGGDLPLDESTRWPCASGRACSSPWRAGRPGGPRVLQTRRPQQFDRRLVGGE